MTGKVAGILETPSFIKQRPQADFATQSGPMLVINGKLPRRTVSYGIVASFDVADQENTEPVSEAATSFYSPSLGRNSNFLPLGPIIGVYGQKEP